MFHLDNFLQYSPINDESKDRSFNRRDSDTGYCSNTSNLNSPNDELLSPENDKDLPFSMFNPPCVEDSMQFEDSSEIFSTFDKPELDLFQSGTHNAQNELINANQKSLCSERTKLIQSENSAFSANLVRYSKPCGVPEVSNSINTQANVRLNGGMQDAMTSQSSFHSSMQNNDVHCFRSNSNTFSDHPLTPNSLLCNNSSSVERLPTSDSLLSPLHSRPEFLRRQLSDGAVHHYIRNGSTFETTYTLGNITEANDYSKQYYTNSQRHGSTSEYNEAGVKHYLTDLGLMDTSMLTLSPSSTSSGKPDLPQDDCIQRFLQTSQDQFSPSPEEPTGSASNLILCTNSSSPEGLLNNSVGDSGPLSSHNSIGTPHAGPENGHIPTEDEAWRSYLENPLTAATTQLISIHGDQDSVAAIGLLYDYYEVPREKRILSFHSDQLDPPDRRQSVQSSEAPASDRLSDEAVITSPLSAAGARNLLSSVINQETAPDVINRIPMSSSDVTTLTSVRPDTGLRVELPSSEYAQIGRVHSSEKMRKSQLTPDSAFSETKDSPPHVNQALSYGEYSQKYSHPSTRQRKQRTSVSSTRNSVGDSERAWPQQHTTTQPLMSSQSNTFTTNSDLSSSENSSDMFEYTMEAPKSLKQKEGEPTMSYINKGQFYCISLRDCSGQAASSKNSRVTSIVQIVFGDAKPEEEQLRHWKYWHARQHTAKQRIIDIADYKESCMISDIEEFAHNAIRFTWDANEVAKIYVSCNCLSTDFSAQKGIKGLPLLIQIDTYLDNRRAGPPDHRGVCQLKVFCDKGAERKIRDEERKAQKKKQKNGSKGSSMTPQSVCMSPVDIKSVIRSPNVSPPLQGAVQAIGTSAPPQKRQDMVHFKTVYDCSTPTVHFVPEIFAHSGMMRSHVTISPGNRLPSESGFMGGMLTPTSGGELEQVFLTGQQMECFDPLRAPKRTQSLVSSEDGDFPANKIPRMWEPEENKKVLLYIRKEADDVYDGVMLREATLDGLKEALQEKYNISAEKITKVLKRSKKGILVNVDDNIVRHYSNEDTFVIEIETEASDTDVIYKVTLCAV